MAGWDWYATLAGLAQVDPSDDKAAAAGLKPHDSLDLWRTLSTMKQTPRTELIIGSAEGANVKSGKTMVGSLIWPPYKLLLGAGEGYREHLGSVWSSEVAPTSNTGAQLFSSEDPVCGRTPADGCLFNIWQDQGEHHNLAMSEPEVFEQTIIRIDELQETVYSPIRSSATDGQEFLAVCRSEIEPEEGLFHLRPWLH
mmetsp:Transcript_18328/g.40091  ORF Transcript_18328/g.40091 Transcript_18328/m.40091 type:complete len:197 (-) Transcript_18328:74-664(-)